MKEEAILNERIIKQAPKPDRNIPHKPYTTVNPQPKPVQKPKK